MSIGKQNKKPPNGGFLYVLLGYFPMISLTTYPPSISPAMAGG